MPHSKTKQKPQHSPYQVQVLDRALAIREALAEHDSDLSLAQISEGLGLHKSTAHRLVRVLERQRRSEEHTSELQSPMYLVCRLLLEKKKKKKSIYYREMREQRRLHIHVQ